MTEVDIAIIGAGAAGIAAARHLQDCGADYLLIEAGDRLGGRAWTDLSTFPGIAFDRGCHWLHSASINPLRAIADRRRIAYDADFAFNDRAFFSGGQQVPDDQAAAIASAAEGFFEAIGANSDGDRPVVNLLDVNRPWYGVFEHYFGLVTSASPGDVSALDYNRGNDTNEDYPVRDGLGALLLTEAEGLKTVLSSPVETIDHSGPAIRIGLASGEIRARAVILTVSTNVLASGAIRFAPELPAALMDAVAGCPQGCYEKVAFLMSDRLDGLPANVTVLGDGGGGPPASFQINADGNPLIVAEIGGPTAADLVAEGDASLVDFARARLSAAFGSALQSSIRASAVTGWTRDPLVRGAYSRALPGHAHLRPRLSEPVDDRLFLAGEATSLDAFASCHGAWTSGIAAAKRALAAE